MRLHDEMGFAATHLNAVQILYGYSRERLLLLAGDRVLWGRRRRGDRTAGAGALLGERVAIGQRSDRNYWRREGRRTRRIYPGRLTGSQWNLHIIFSVCRSVDFRETN